ALLDPNRTHREFGTMKSIVAFVPLSCLALFLATAAIAEPAPQAAPATPLTPAPGTPAPEAAMPPQGKHTVKEWTYKSHGKTVHVIRETYVYRSDDLNAPMPTPPEPPALPGTPDMAAPEAMPAPGAMPAPPEPPAGRVVQEWNYRSHGKPVHIVREYDVRSRV